MLKRPSSVSRLFLALAVLVPLGAVGSATAFAQSTVEQRLSNAKSLDCTFTVVSMGTWNDGQAQADVVPLEISLGFEEIDTDQGSAHAVGSAGGAEVVVAGSSAMLHFIESLKGGPVFLTTVLARETTGGKLQAVYTRHESATYWSGYISRPQQFLGECTPEP